MVEPVEKIKFAKRTHQLDGWPSGAVQELQNVAPNKMVTITEPPLLLAAITNGVPQFWLKGGRGPVYEIQASSDLGTWTSIGTLTVTNATGTALITDSNAPGIVRRFYRAISR